MAAIARILTVSILVAVGACVLGSLLLYGAVDRFSFIPLLWTLVGSCLVLAPAYGVLRDYQVSSAMRYSLLLATGAVAGAVMLGLFGLEGIAIGGFYGLITALCWVVLHFGSKQALARLR